VALDEWPGAALKEPLQGFGSKGSAEFGGRLRIEPSACVPDNCVVPAEWLNNFLRG